MGKWETITRETVTSRNKCYIILNSAQDSNASGTHPLLPSTVASAQGWANLDQAPKDLDKTIFRDLSLTPLP